MSEPRDEQIVMIPLSLVREFVNDAWKEPVEFIPTGWREKYPALREPNGKELRARIFVKLHAFKKTVLK